MLCLCALFVTPVADLDAQQLPIRAYTTADGLPHNDVRRIVRDSRGFLWFCTADGLARFDGYAFTRYGTEQGLPDSYVNDLLETSAGDYWVATRGGLARFDPRGTPSAGAVSVGTVRATRPMFAVVPPEPDGVHARYVTALREGRDGTLWVGTGDGLYRLNDADGRRFLRPVDIGMPHVPSEHREVLDILEDRHGSLWIAAPSGLYRRWPDGLASRYDESDGLPGSYVQDVLEDLDGRLWAATRTNGYFRFTADATRSAPVVDRAFTKTALPTPWVFQLFQSSDRRFWVATARGLLEFFAEGDGGGRRFQQYSARNGLTYFDIAAVEEDLGGNLWLGTTNAGVMRLASNGLSSYGAGEGIQLVGGIFHDRTGRVCVRADVLGDQTATVFEGAGIGPATSTAIDYHQRFGCLDGDRLEWFQISTIPDPGWVTQRVTLQSRSGQWWVGAGGGLSRFREADHLPGIKTQPPLAVYSLKDGLAARQIFRLFEDSSGNVWVSTTASGVAGLARWEPTTGRLRDMAGSPELAALTNDWPARAFKEDRAGNVWIGFERELVRYANGHFEVFTSADGLPPGNIQELELDGSGDLWFASSKSGLVRVERPTAARPRFVSYGTNEGLSSNNTAVVLDDGAGHLYVGGGRGLDRFDPATGNIRHLGPGDGLVSGSFASAFRDRQGVLWFGTTSGLIRLAPRPERPTILPVVLIGGLRVAGVARQVSALGEVGVDLPDLQPTENNLEIDFVGLAFGSGDVLRYEYRLEGANADWSAPTARRTISYASLAPGPYRFAVRALNSDGSVSAEPATVRFTILRPIWQRWWFLSLTTLAIGLAVLVVVRARIARVLDLANMRTHIATDLHDDVGANLTRIALLSEVAQQTRPDGSLESIARIARESVGAMGDIVWAINPKRETLRDLIRRMRQHADEVFTLRGVDLRFTAPAEAATQRLGMDVRRDLLLIFKEAVNNVTRHSECTVVDIDLRVAGSRLSLSVSDNGVGFDTSTESGGQGLMSMARRAQRLGATLAITSTAGTGTRVVLEAPI